MSKMAGISLFFLLLASCGGSISNIAISLQSATAFANPNVADVVFIAENQMDAQGKILDGNGDGLPDAFVFPSGCTVTFPNNQISISAGCGLSPGESGTFELGSLPVGYNYLIEVRFRDASGATLERGRLTIVNDGGSQELTIFVGPVT